jgi:predicted phosphodiesterase
LKLLLVGDIHIADRPPSIRTEAYSAQILDKLTQTVVIARDENVDGVVWVGDVFHVKAASRTSHALVQRIIEIGQSYSRPWVIVPGNHDLSNDRLESLEKQPLGVLYTAGATIGVGHVVELDIFCIPWLRDWANDLEAKMSAWAECDAPLMVVHASIMPPNENAPYEFYDAVDWGRMMSRPGDVFYGHIHDNHGVYSVEMSGPDSEDEEFVTFCNVGAISRGSLHESTLKRKPHVVLYDSTKEQRFTPVPLEHLPAEEVFRLDIKAVDDDRAEKLGKFLESVEDTELEGLSVEAVMAHIESLDLSDLCRTQIHECLEEAMAK